MRKYLIYGTEPYLIDKYRKEIVQQVVTPAFNYLEADEFTEEVKGFLRQMPLLGNEKILVYRAKNLKDCSALLEYIPKSGKKIGVYFFVKEVDKRTKLFKQFSKEEQKVFDKVSSDVLRKTIIQYIKKNDCEITPDAYQHYLQVINYYSEETNLYDVINSLNRLCCAKVITPDMVSKIVMNRETENVFSLIQLIVEQKYVELYHQTDLILQGQTNNVIGVLSLLLRNYRLAYKIRVCNCSLKSLGVYSNSYIPPLSADACNDSMNVLDDAISKIKKGYYRPEIAFRISIAKLCQISKK